MLTPVPVFSPLTWHAGASLLMEEVRQGRERAMLVGAKGVGKSMFAREVARASAGGPRQVVYTSMAEVRSGAGVLAAVLEGVSATTHTAGRTLLAFSDRARRRGASYLLAACAEELAMRDIGALALDEAAHLGTAAVAHVTQLIDHCHLRHQHVLGLALITTTLEYRGLQESGELGQRISTVLHVPSLTADEVAQLLEALAPSLARALQKAGVRARDDLTGRLVSAVDGSCRRLVDILRRAEAIAERHGRVGTLDDLALAIGMQASAA